MNTHLRTEHENKLRVCHKGISGLKSKIVFLDLNKYLHKSSYEIARKRQLKLLETGFDLGTKGHISISREELHARG